jgi:hypothetical protein
MLRPLLYRIRKDFFVKPSADVATIRAMSNPIICWGARFLLRSLLRKPLLEGAYRARSLRSVISRISEYGL